MSDLNKPGFSGSPPKHQGRRLVTPPRTLPSQLDVSSPLVFDSRSVPFSPTSPGKRSPGRPKTMKEYEEDLVNLRRENFNLKVRIYFMEQSRFDPNLPKDIDELRNSYTDLKVEYELQKKDLSRKEDLLLSTYRALDAQKQQLEAMQTEHEAEKLDLLSKVDALEKELKEYHLKFLETSVQLDDTNAMYALTFGVNNRTEPKKEDNGSDEHIKEIESKLARATERVMMLEENIAGLNAKAEHDKSILKHLNKDMQTLEDKLIRTMKERDLLKETLNEATNQATKYQKDVNKKDQILKQKESECDMMKNKIKILQEELTSSHMLQEKDRSNTQTELKNHIKKLYTENYNLKKELKHLQLQSESRRHLRERSTGRRSSDQEKELASQLKGSQKELEELQTDFNNLKRIHSGCENAFQLLMRDHKLLKKEVVELKAISNFNENHSGSLKEEVSLIFNELNKGMSSEKDKLISQLKCEIEKLTEAVSEKESQLQEYKTKVDSTQHTADSRAADNDTELKKLEEKLIQNEKEKEMILKKLEGKQIEVESLTKELKKKTFNLQGLVNTELWDKNREIEKLNKVCDRRLSEVLKLQKQLTIAQDKVSDFVAPITLQSGLFVEDKENMLPQSDPTIQLQHLTEEKRLLTRKVEELQVRLLNTPERDTESLLVQTLRMERDQAEKLRKEAVNACMLLTTRLKELADFLDSLLPSLCGKKRKVVQQAVERSRELSKSLSLAAEESTLHCSAWTDIQPSLYVPLLPDISTVDFWSGDECQEEALSGGEVARLKSQVETLTEEVKQRDGEIARFQSGKNFSDSFLLKSVFNFDELQLSESNQLVGNIADFSEGSLLDTFSDQSAIDQAQPNKLSPELKSVNIGKITLTSRKKDTHVSKASVMVEDTNKPVEKDGGLSEYETWSEPDRDVSYARMGLKEDSASMTKTVQPNFDDTSETADSVPKSPSSKRSSEIQRLNRKIRNLEQLNETLRSELDIFHKLAPPVMNRQDKATSIELSRQSLLSVPSHLLEEIRNQREKLEASLFHNDYIRRQLESTVSSLQRSQGEGQERASFARLNEVTNQLEVAECELVKLKLEKEQWNRKMEMAQATLQQTSNNLIEKQCSLLELENKTSKRLKEVEEKYNQKCSQTEQKYLELEQKWTELCNEKDQLIEKLSQGNERITKLSAEVENYEQEGKKNKQLQDALNIQLQQTCQQNENLQRVIAEQEQLLADAERERQELATQLIVRDREVSELQKQLGNVELASRELEAALRSQLDLATHQCAQFEAKIREVDSCNKRREDAARDKAVDLQRRLDSARAAHSEAVLQYSRVASDNIRLQQDLRRRQYEPNQISVVERMKNELERRVAELEAVNAELESRLTSLHVVKPPYSDCDTDAGSSEVGSPRRHLPPPLAIPISPSRTQRSRDLTSDYLSDQEAALSPQAQIRNLWYPTSPHSHMSAPSPDLGIESDHGRFSSLETQVPKSTAVSLRGIPVPDLMKLEEENTQLRCNLQKTRQALEQTLEQLTAANHHKAKVERAICRQLHKTHSILKKAKVNLQEEDLKGESL